MNALWYFYFLVLEISASNLPIFWTFFSPSDYTVVIKTIYLPFGQKCWPPKVQTKFRFLVNFFIKVTTRQQQIASKFIILWIICPRKRWLQTVSLSYKKIAIIQKDETTARWSGYKKCSTRVCFRFECHDGQSNKKTMLKY